MVETAPERDRASIQMIKTLTWTALEKDLEETGYLIMKGLTLEKDQNYNRVTTDTALNLEKGPV